MGKNRETSRRGFTLIEILVVVAVVGFLAAVTVPAVSSARDRGQAAAVQAEVSSYEAAASMYLAETGAYPVPDQDDIEDSCFEYDGAPGAYANPRLCCIADQACTYAGRELAPLSRGAFASSGGQPGVLRGALPSLPRLPARPIAASNLQYQGVFYSCNDASCRRPNVTWTQPTACPAGTTRNGVSGLCQREIDRTPVIVIEQTETYCYDGEDNDGDSSADCADDDCAGRARCGAEGSSERCGDEFDNDGDGEADCEDGDCAGTASCPPPEPETACDDGTDNDGDSSADCLDYDCDGQPGPQGHVCQPHGEMACEDAFDNDGDRLVDCADVATCAGTTSCSPPEPETACGDGIDNDGDWGVDCADQDCYGSPECGL